MKRILPKVAALRAVTTTLVAVAPPAAVETTTVVAVLRPQVTMTMKFPVRDNLFKRVCLRAHPLTLRWRG